MKILHYTGVYAPAWKIGGPARSVSQICEGLVKLGHEVTVFTTDAGLVGDPSFITGVETIRNGVKVTYFPVRYSFMGIRSQNLEEAVRKRLPEFDILHVTGVWQPTSIAACRAAERAGIPYVISPRGALGPYSWTQKPWKKVPYWYLFERRNCHRASSVHYTTTMEAEECKRFKFPGQRVIIPNSVGLEFWQRDHLAGQAFRSQLGIGTETRLILNAGRLHHKKGLDLLPEALSPLRDKDWHLVFVGHPEDGTKVWLQELFLAKGLEEKVTYIDHLEPEQLRAAYSAADLFVLPSRHENFGNVVIEALSCGAPVIISDKVGLSTELQEITGVQVFKHNKGDWTRAISEALLTGHNDGQVRQPELQNLFSLKAVSKAIARHYAEILKGETDL